MGVIHAEEIKGKVVGVADADTITVLDAANTQHKIRFEGIDAPEESQDYGTKATEALKAAIGGSPVRVVTSGRDKYGREMGTVFAGDRNLNSWLIENGWAWHYKKYSTDAKLAELEKSARIARVGLWAYSKAPIAPWDFRSLQKQQAAVKKGRCRAAGVLAQHFLKLAAQFNVPILPQHLEGQDLRKGRREGFRDLWGLKAST